MTRPALTFTARVVRKLRYRPFWVDLAARAARSAMQADMAYLIAKGFDLTHFVGLPYLALTVVAALAAITSIVQTCLLTVAGAHNLPPKWNVPVTLVKTFLAAFAGVALVGTTPVAALLSVEHAADVAFVATMLAALSLIRPRTAVPVGVGYGTVA